MLSPRWGHRLGGLRYCGSAGRRNENSQRPALPPVAMQRVTPGISSTGTVFMS